MSLILTLHYSGTPRRSCRELHGERAFPTQKDRDPNLHEIRIPVLYFFYRSQFFTVLGYGSTSRMLAMPVIYMTQRSNPRPKPECLTVPYFLRSR